MPFDQPPRTPCQPFPEVLILASESTIKRHGEYPAAKLGDVAAASRLIVDVMGDDAYAIVERALSGRQPTVVAVHAIEREGINRIPAVLAQAIAERLDLPVDRTIVQINRVSPRARAAGTDWRSRRCSMATSWSASCTCS